MYAFAFTKKNLPHIILAVNIPKYDSNYIQHLTTLDLIGQIWLKDYGEIQQTTHFLKIFLV